MSTERAARGLGLGLGALLLLGQASPAGTLAPLAHGRRDLCGREGCDEAADVRLPARVRARVLARREPEVLGTPVRRWRLLLDTPTGSWATEPLGEDATICGDTESSPMTWHFRLHTLEARDVLGASDPEVVMAYIDTRHAAAVRWVMVCSVEASPPSCSAPYATDPGALLDDVLTPRGSVRTLDPTGAVVEQPIALR